MKFKKIFALFITFSMILPLFISCAGESAGNLAATTEADSKNSGGEIPDESGEAPLEDIKILPDLPEKDFGGYEFKIITSDYKTNAIMPQEIGAEEETGDPVNDAVYKRNKKIEEQYNVTIKEILHDRDTLNAPVKKAIAAADGAYDLIAGNIRELGIIAQRKELLDLNAVNYLDLSKPWYDQNAAADLSIGHKLFFAVGELQISNKDGTWGILFNKKMLQQLGLDDPYQFVRKGSWTMDKMFELASAANKDLNGDGIMDETDQWGMLGEEFNIFALMNGSGTRLVQKDENDLPYYAGYTPRDVDIFEKGAEYLGDPAKSILPGNYSSKGYTDIWMDFINPMFSTDRVLFFFTSLSRVTWHRNFETDFGILPVPKYDESQANYVNTVSVWLACGMGMPVTLSGEDLDRTAIITEALNAESMYTLTPAYYDTQLKNKLVRDDESAEMLDIIFANRVYSTPQLYDWGGVVSAITGMLTAKNRNFVSSIEKIENKITKDIEKTIAAYES